MKHWGAVGLIRSYFALFEKFDEALGKFKKNGTGFAYNDKKRYSTGFAGCARLTRLPLASNLESRISNLVLCFIYMLI